MSSSDRHRNLERIVDSGVVAVMRGADADSLIQTAEALERGGVSAIEITADNPGAMEMIRDVSGAFGDEVIVGAGTVLDAETARSTLLAGAEFVVGPNFEPDVVETCNRYNAVVAPGVMTPTEAVRAMEAGSDFVKVFPASTLGPGHLKSMKGPLGQIPMMPTGGVDVDNAADFVDAGAMVVGAGSALVDGDAVAEGDFEAITEQARRFSDVVDEARDS
ncbi:bifunctional 4-hydroxy-2-oxoglutarate aldolase/2-dehydro-3-deoxy-phosphogluconate aldolase [Haloprofundus sp. MHR1]|uniref:bifunctional 4-hydroxy-2-oxoglutarate aldolase/2-dehydro-3-deoxy-phosphogluconate aldolase n=1 Tax=Haloprofundus sp. MHR1 TaxID=2572921 RepID=UPI0010BE4DB7|nr:bifunctional 4-hydroxy-2-oxoglutarate aldolase/2-dehydro-3-deoxy-phosphogluconate aldolase [Haloprofundus sp. MHR1]QCJ47932.1 bifunctional 4-hydroxy-2-oxoglutarate aldolase/2-dehydro-3-deoxy-phosphogluconate aldolase [Haloprofundus sp. MHR1]